MRALLLAIALGGCGSMLAQPCTKDADCSDAKLVCATTHKPVVASSNGQTFKAGDAQQFCAMKCRTDDECPVRDECCDTGLGWCMQCQTGHGQ